MAHDIKKGFIIRHIERRFPVMHYGTKEGVEHFLHYLTYPDKPLRRDMIKDFVWFYFGQQWRISLTNTFVFFPYTNSGRKAK